jgi:ferritin-like metal-binding protein YciE
MANEQHGLKTYVSDMLALQKHILQPITLQANDADVQRYPEAQQIVSRIQSTVQGQIDSLARQLEILGGHEASPVKEAWSSLLGFGAAAVDKVRKTEVSKSLRDDYTALSLSAISFTMLHTTALALGDRATAQLAERCLNELTPLIVEISRVMPSVVIAELRDTGLSVTQTVTGEATANTQQAWSGR